MQPLDQTAHRVPQRALHRRHRDQRQLTEGLHRSHLAPDDRLQHTDRFTAPLVHVDVRIRVVTDQALRNRGQLLGDVGVQIERDDDRHRRPDQVADRRHDRPLGVLVVVADHRTV